MEADNNEPGLSRENVSPRPSEDHDDMVLATGLAVFGIPPIAFRGEAVSGGITRSSVIDALRQMRLAGVVSSRSVFSALDAENGLPPGTVTSLVEDFAAGSSDSEAGVGFPPPLPPGSSPASSGGTPVMDDRPPSFRTASGRRLSMVLEGEGAVREIDGDLRRLVFSPGPSASQKRAAHMLQEFFRRARDRFSRQACIHFLGLLTELLPQSVWEDFFEAILASGASPSYSLGPGPPYNLGSGFCVWDVSSPGSSHTVKISVSIEEKEKPVHREPEQSQARVVHERPLIVEP